MSRFILVLMLILAAGCGSKQAREQPPITMLGTITAKEIVDLEEVKKGTSTRTSVYGSISSGGRVSIGLGVLLYPFLKQDVADPVRYLVKVEDDNEMTIYHDSHDFEVGDCVEIKVYPDEEKNPPQMKRKKGAC